MLRYCIVIVILITFSCTQEDEKAVPPSSTSSLYFPLEEDFQVEYDIFEVVYRNNGSVRDTMSYLLKEVYSGNYLNSIGETVHIVDRYTKTSEAGSWNYLNSWQAYISNNQAIRIEDNRPYIKLQFPLNVNNSWEGNQLFDASDPINIGGTFMEYYKNWSSKVLEVTSYNVDDRIFDQAYIISIANHENRLERRYGREVYAPSIGLIYRELEILDTQCFDQCIGQSWPEKAEAGHIFIQRIRK